MAGIFCFGLGGEGQNQKAKGEEKKKDQTSR